MDLFDQAPLPPHRKTETSRDAARKIQGRSVRLEEQIMGLLRTAGFHGYTPDEAAEALNEDILNVRPRFCRLRDAEPPLITELTGLDGKFVTRPNKKGNRTQVWILASLKGR